MFLSPKKSLGQHFLNSKHVLEQIIEAAKIENGQLILEIGPGTGVLTDSLLKNGARVIAIEKDSRAIEKLQERFQREIGNGQLNIISGDILDEIAIPIKDGEDFSIVANIPYYITGAILQKFLENPNKPKKMVLLVQKEVADRIIARDSKESILSISVKIFGQAKIIAKVPPGAFIPPPKVDSAILAIENINDDLLKQKNLEISSFFKVIKAGFAHKRKFAIRNLELITKKEIVEKVWQKLNLDNRKRAEDLTVTEWLMIASEINI